MKVLVIGGMHGNEPLGQEVVALFKANPTRNVDVILANKQAIRAKKRFIRNDLNRSFPGDIRSNDYEIKRAAELTQLAKSYDVVLDFHNTHCPDNDCSFVGETAKEELCDISEWLGLSRVVVANYDCVNKYLPNCLSIEISLASALMDAKEWYKRIKKLASLSEIVSRQKIVKYRFVYRMTIEDKKKFNLPQYNMRAFDAINTELATIMKVENPAYPIFINDDYTPYNYGGLLNIINK